MLLTVLTTAKELGASSFKLWPNEPDFMSFA